jgi:hypothetical protein
MRITRVSPHHKHLPMLCSSFTCSLEPGVTSADVVIVRVETNAGLVGHGKAGAVGGYPNCAAGMLAGSAELISRHLIHKDQRDLNAIGHLMSLIDGHGSIKSAFDITCWDLLGQPLGQPLSVILGGKLREAVPVYRGLPLKKPEEMGKEAAAWRTEGYRMFLMKVGCGDLDEDIAPCEWTSSPASSRWPWRTRKVARRGPRQPIHRAGAPDGGAARPGRRHRAPPAGPGGRQRQPAALGPGRGAGAPAQGVRHRRRRVSVSNALGKLLNLTDKLAQARNDAVHQLRAVRARRAGGQGRARQPAARGRRQQGRRREGHRAAARRRVGATTRTPRSSARRWRSTPST